MSKIIPMCQCKHCKTILEHTSENFPSQNDGSLRHVCRVCVLMQQRETKLFGKDSNITYESLANEVKVFKKFGMKKLFKMGVV
ncbi:MAG: hypothetical protein GY710_06295 [Desulfobacteraceae bacterium]|nr:hypothetical protein [Desulfobacteraceae bacterium]